MTPSTLTLAELVARGMLTMDGQRPGPNAVGASVPARPTSPIANARRNQTEAAPLPVVEPDWAMPSASRRMQQATDGMVRKLQWITTNAARDPLDMRRQLLRVIETYVIELGDR